MMNSVTNNILQFSLSIVPVVVYLSKWKLEVFSFTQPPCQSTLKGEKNGEKAAITGFYSYGEICPTAPTEKQCQLHNQTMTITTFKEE